MIKFIKPARIFQIIVFIYLSTIAALALALPDQFVAKCSLTPQVFNDKTKPKTIGSTNNLIRKTGAILQADGKEIYLQARLLDKKCVPISDAKVEMWQTNTHGIYQYEFNTRDKKHKFNRALLDPNFIGSGRSVTNNLGQFNFITIMPGANGNYAPSLNIRITHADFEEFETKIYFSDVKYSFDLDLKNISPSLHKALIAELVDEPNSHGVKSYYINLTLPVVNKYRRF